MFDFFKKKKVPNWGVEIERDDLSESDIQWLDSKAKHWAIHANSAELIGRMLDKQCNNSRYRDFYIRAAINELNLRIPKRNVKDMEKV